MNTKKIIFPITCSMVVSFSLLYNSCTYNKGPDPADCDTNPVTIQSVNITQATCGVEDGGIDILANGGDETYLYSIDGSTFQENSSFTGLMAGNYEVTVKDGKECAVTGTAIVTNNSGFSINVHSTESGCGGANGSVTITTSGGVDPIQYKINDGTYQDNNVITGLTQGSINVFARDSIGCIVVAQVKILTGISLDKDIMPLLKSNCALSGCHDGASGHPNWTNKATVIDHAANIKKRTTNKEMPPAGNSITDAEIQIIACWVDDGAKNN